MSSYKAPGKDGIPIDIIKLLPQHLRDNYLYIFNECLYHQCIPKC
jgi:hypothetical protein